MPAYIDCVDLVLDVGAVVQAEAPNVDPVNDEPPDVAHAADAAIEDPTPLVLPESRVNPAAEKEGQLHRQWNG